MTKPITLTADTFSSILAASRNEIACGLRTHVALYSNGMVRTLGTRETCEATGQRTFCIADLLARVIL